jgi:hypothetical protein
MARKILVNLDFGGNQILNVLAQVLASDPGSPTNGQFWYNSTSATFNVRLGGATIALGRLDQISAPTADVSLNSHKITNLLDPSGAQDAASKAYVDSVATGLDVKASVRVATAAALAAYTRSGNVITANANGVMAAVDGVTLVAGDRILLKDGAAGADNGIYTVTSLGSAGTPFVLTRATDADSSAEVTPGMYVFTEEGTTNSDAGFVLTTNAPITLNTTALTFTQFTGAGQITAGAGLTKTGNTLDVGAGTGISVAADTVGIDTALVVRKYAASIGDGAATSYNVDHNLGSLDVEVQVFANADGTQVEPDITRSTTNRVIVAFTTAPTTNQYRVLVQG